MAETDEGQRLLLVGPMERCGTLETTELLTTLATYLEGVNSEVRSVEADVEDVAFARVQSQMIDLAADVGATVVVWCQRGTQDTALVHVLDVRGETALVRTLELGDQPPVVLHRTVSAVIRTVVESGMLEQASRAERSPPPTTSTDIEAAPSGSEPDEGATEEASPIGVALSLGYMLRIGQQPDPVVHAVGMRLWLSAVEWLVLAVGGRFAIPTSLQAGVDGRAMRAALTAAVGFGRPIGVVTFGALLGADLEWLWGAAGADRGLREFDALEVGGTVEAFLVVALWRGLELTVSVGVKLCPNRRVFLYSNTPIASTDHVEGDAELGLRWNFL